MTIWNLGSINADIVYRVPHLPAPGETLAARDRSTGLGGKGANMSVAAARAGARVVHIGAVGAEGGWMVDRLAGYGVETGRIAVTDGSSGHAVIAVDDAGENSILLFHGANHGIDEEGVATALTEAAPGDWFLFQNETNAGRAGAEAAKAGGLRVAHAAAPFDAGAVREVLDLVDLLVLNEVEAAQLEAATGRAVADLPVADVVVTLGAKGCRWIATGTGDVVEIAGRPVRAVDTTGAGDTFTGYLVAGLDRGLTMPDALDLAGRAAALKVTRAGAADAIPALAEVEAG